jgi:hypothetical protein
MGCPNKLPPSKRAALIRDIAVYGLAVVYFTVFISQFFYYDESRPVLDEPSKTNCHIGAK